MKRLLLFGALLFTGALHAQSNVVVSGGNGNSAAGTFSYTVGQIDYQYLTGPGGSASSGIQQAYELLTSDLTELLSIEFITYPNPVYDFMIVSISDETPSDYSIIIYDGSGRFIEKYELENKENKIPLAHLKASIYFIELQKAGQLIGQEKIIKH